MSVEALSWAFTQEHVPSGPRFVLVALANRANEEGGDLYPSLRWIKKKTGIPERTIRQYITDLERLGLLFKTERRRDDGGRTSNEYRLPLTQPGLRFDTPPAATAVGGDATAAGVAVAAAHPRRQPPPPPAATAGQETKEETKEKKKSAAARATRLPADFKISDNVRAWARKQGFEPYLQAHFDYFVLDAESRSGAKYTDWDKALMKAISADWGGVRKQAQMAARRGEAVVSGGWWKSVEGVTAKGGELGVAPPAEKPPGWFTQYKARVFVAAGEGPWIDERDATVHRMVLDLREKAAA